MIIYATQYRNIFFMYILNGFCKLNITYFQDDIVKEFKEEIRKLKAMIVKHENRIRALEARAAEDTTDTAKDSGDSVHKNNDQNDLEIKDNDTEHVDTNDDDD